MDMSEIDEDKEYSGCCCYPYCQDYGKKFRVNGHKVCKFHFNVFKKGILHIIQTKIEPKAQDMIDRELRLFRQFINKINDKTWEEKILADTEDQLIKLKERLLKYGVNIKLEDLI